MREKFLKISEFFKRNLFVNFVYLILASSGLFLLVNRYPYFGIFSILTPLFIGIIFLFYKGSITSTHLSVAGILAVIYVYFILSYFISNQTLHNFFSYSFLRYDGNFFFCYISFFAFAVPYLNYEKVSRIYFNLIFFTFPLLVIAGIIGILTRNYSPIIINDTHDGLMLFGLNEAHNATGSVYALSSLFALVFTLNSHGRKKVFYIIVFILCLIGLALTQSRGSYIGFFTGALFVIWLHYRSILKFIITLFAILAASLPVMIISNMYNRFMKLFDPTNWAVGSRMELWEKALYLFRLSPIFGVGFGRFNDIDYNINNYGYTLIRLEEFVGIRGVLSVYHAPNFDFNSAHAHNSYLHFLAETGIVGLGLLVLFWILCFRFVMRAYNYTEMEFSKNIYLSCLGGIVVLFIMSFTENYLSATTIMMCMSVVTSLSLGLYWQENYNKENNIKKY
jgi:O-antigen ligase